MPALRAWPYQRVAIIFERAGCVYSHTKGDHLIYQFPGAIRPVVIPKYREVPVLIIQNNMKIIGQQIFAATQGWPQEEKYALTDQIRRSSRSVGANLAEAWAKRRYPAHFLSKLTDADGELQETWHWLRSAADCHYVSETQLTALTAGIGTVAGKLGAMIREYESFCR